MSVDWKEFPAAGARQWVVKLLYILASFWETLHFYLVTTQRRNVEIAPLSESVFLPSLFCCLEHPLNNISLPVLLSYSVILLLPFLLHVSMGILSTRVLLTSSRIPAMGTKGQPFRSKFVSL